MIPHYWLGFNIHIVWRGFSLRKKKSFLNKDCYSYNLMVVVIYMYFCLCNHCWPQILRVWFPQKKWHWTHIIHNETIFIFFLIFTRWSKWKSFHQWEFYYNCFHALLGFLAAYYITHVITIFFYSKVAFLC